MRNILVCWKSARGSLVLAAVLGMLVVPGSALPPRPCVEMASARGTSRGPAPRIAKEGEVANKDKRFRWKSCSMTRSAAFRAISAAHTATARKTR